MGQLVIEVPQNINRSYRINSEERGAKILRELEDLTEDSARIPAIIPPSRHSLEEDGNAVLGIWSDREETADEIARRVREQNRKTK